MDEVLSALSNQAAAAPSRAQTSQTAINADFDTFITLLTTQLQNQDPLNPTDTAEFTNQLVLYTQAEQQIRTNSQLEQLIALNQNGGATNALGYIGNEVSFIGDLLHSDGFGGEQEFTLNLQDVPDELTVAITNSDGETVRVIEAEQQSGNQRLVWDGLDNNGNPVPEGLYAIQVTAEDVQNNQIASGTRVNAQVIGIENSAADGSFFLTLAGERLVTLDSVLSVRLPDQFLTTQQNSNS